MVYCLNGLFTASKASSVVQFPVKTTEVTATDTFYNKMPTTLAALPHLNEHHTCSCVSVHS